MAKFRWAALIAMLGISFSLARPASAASACTCTDRADLLNRLNEAEFAIFSYNHEIATLLAQEAATGEKIKATKENYKKSPKEGPSRNSLQDRVQDQLDMITDGKANHGSGDTDFGDCKTTLSPGTSACLSEVIHVHEDVHVAACKATSTASLILSPATLVDKAREEIRAYTAERDDLLSILKSLPCRPSGWFGVAAYRITAENTSSTIAKPHTSEYDDLLSGSGGVSHKQITQGFITELDGGSRLDQAVTLEHRSSETAQHKVLCSRKKGEKEDASSQASSETLARGDVSKSGKFLTVGLSGKKTGKVGFTAAHTTLSGSRSETGSTTGGCTQKPPLNASFPFTGGAEGAAMSVPVTLSDDGLTLTGEMNDWLSPKIESKDANGSFSAGTFLDARVALHRLDGK